MKHHLQNSMDPFTGAADQDFDLVSVILTEVLYRMDQQGLSSAQQEQLRAQLEPIVTNRILATILASMNDEDRRSFEEISSMDAFDPSMLSMLLSRKEVVTAIEDELGKLVDELTNIPL